MSTKTLDYLEKITKGPMTFGRMLLALRMSDEVSQIDLANSIGVSRSLICDIEKGRRMPTIIQVKLIAKSLGYSEQGLLAIFFQDQLKQSKLNYRVVLEPA